MAEPTGTIRSVERAMRVLAHFSAQQPQWTVSDLARATGVHKSVITRLLATMARAGFMVQDPVSRAYRVGPKAFAVGSTYRPHAILSQIAEPVMRRVTDRCGHAASIGTPAGGKFVYLLVNESKLPIRVVANVGEERDYHANATGKVLLAGMGDAEVRRLLGDGPLPRHTAHTITSAPALRAELDRVRRDGVAYNRQEAVLGVGAVAAPIVDGAGACVAGMSIVYPIHLVTDDEAREMESLVRAATSEISAALSR
ncbi:MAG TPA: IclR family transcriptional regulator [Thermomicrobiales bacterium]|nr:IclR family transcriptional regulator [Thermomicrobiales bacterium]